MENIKYKILAYAKANGVNSVNFRTEVKIIKPSDADIRIDAWNLSIAEPTDTQLASYETAALQLQTAEDAKQYQRDRANEYPSIADQLDKIYHSGIDEWKKVIKTTKDKYPK